VAQNNGEVSRAPFAAVAETHSAVVYFAGDRAYKLKRPVNLDFLDVTTRQARAAACARGRPRSSAVSFSRLSPQSGLMDRSMSGARHGRSCSPARCSHGGRGPRAGHALPLASSAGTGQCRPVDLPAQEQDLSCLTVPWEVPPTPGSQCSSS
jgi:hypothetical protein